MNIRLNCWLDPDRRNGPIRIVGIEGLFGDEAPLPVAIRYLARPNNDIPIRDKSTWYEGAEDAEWQDADLLWCAASPGRTIGWRVPADRFVPYRSYRFAVRDPWDDPSVLSQTELPPLVWPDDSQAEHWPCAPTASATAGKKAPRIRTLQAALLAAGLIALPLGWALSMWPSQPPSIDRPVVRIPATPPTVEPPPPSPAIARELDPPAPSVPLDPPPALVETPPPSVDRAPDRAPATPAAQAAPPPSLAMARPLDSPAPSTSIDRLPAGEKRTDAPKEAPEASPRTEPPAASADRAGAPATAPARAQADRQASPPVPDEAPSAIRSASTALRPAAAEAPPAPKNVPDPAAAARAAVFKEIVISLRARREDDARSLCLSEGGKDAQVARWCGTAFDPLRTHRAPTSDKSFALRCYDLAVALGDLEAERRAKALRDDPD